MLLALIGGVEGRYGQKTEVILSSSASSKVALVTTMDDKNATSSEGLETVRFSPDTYIGSTGPHGLHHMVREIVDNAVEEFLAGHCSKITVTINADDSITVKDDGRGISTELVKDVGKTLLEVVFTDLNLGYTLSRGGYRVEAGLHGIGTPVVNALSEWLKVEVARDGRMHRQTFARGKADGAPENVGPTKEHGTTVTFLPDREIFFDVDEQNKRTKITLRSDVLETYLQEMAFLSKGLEILLEDRRGGGAPKSMRFYFKDGIVNYAEFLNNSKRPLHSPPIYFKQSRDTVLVECALQWTDTDAESIYAFVNNANTSEGGTHFIGFRDALLKVINDLAHKSGLIANGALGLRWESVGDGLTAIVSVRVPQAQFEGEMKERLSNKEVQDITESVVFESMSKWVASNPKVAQEIVARAVKRHPV